MPVARYFLFVGGVLLALLLAVDALVPQQAVVASQAAPTIDKTVVRIRSDQRPPERVVYDTTLPTIVPPQAVTAQAVACCRSGRSCRPTPLPKPVCGRRMPSTSRQKQRSPSRRFSVSARLPRTVPHIQPTQVAQQSHPGFFGGSNWNSTW